MDYYKLKVLNNKRKILLIVILLFVISLILFYFFVYRKNDNKNEIVKVNETIVKKDNDNRSDNISSGDLIYVDIKGFVNKPGVYSFNQIDNARINDLINKAGGLKKDADTSTINLSKKLEDEMAIIIYSKSEITNIIKTQEDLSKKLEICESKLNNNACIKIEEKNTKININEASLEELLTLNGIGEAKAKLIIEYRSKNKFKNIEEIKNVQGIGESLYITIKENITV